MPKIEWGKFSRTPPPRKSEDSWLWCHKCERYHPPEEFDTYRRKGIETPRPYCREWRRRYQNARYTYVRRRRAYVRQRTAEGHEYPEAYGPRHTKRERTP